MDNLSQDELDALIDEASEESEENLQEEELEEAVGAVGDAGAMDQTVEKIVQAFDFNQPFSLSRGFDRTLRNICENFSKDASLGSSNIFRTTATFTSSSLRLSSFGEVISGLENPSCLSLATMVPLKGAILLCLDAGIVFTMFTKLLGGPVEEAGHIRDFTEIEMGMARKPVDRFLGFFKGAAEKIIALDPIQGQMENNPSYISPFNEGETVVNLEFSIAIDEVRGRLNFVMPLGAFEPVMDVFDPKEGLELRSATDKARDRSRISEALRQSTSHVAARFASRHISLSELLSLKVNDILNLGHPVSQPLSVHVEGKAMFDGIAGRSGQNRAIQILKRRQVS